MTHGSPKSNFFPFIVALDGAWKDVKIWADRLEGRVWGFKIGSILFAEQGPSVVDYVKKRGHRVFLDLKFHDIPNTVQHAVRESFKMGADFLTVHACGGRAMLEAAASEQRLGTDSSGQHSEQRILAVTVLTSLDQADLASIGVSRQLNEQVASLGELAVNAGIGGLVCSPREVAELRKKFSSTTLVTPGVRLEAGGDDQKRTETIATALGRGASYVVLGRALTGASDWEKTWEQITSSLDETSSKKLSL